MTKFYKKWQFFLLILPLFIFYTAFTILPIIMDIGYSFMDWRSAGKIAYNGLGNYAKLFNDKYLVIALKNTLIIVMVMLVTVLPISFFVAYTLNRQCRTNNAIKTAIFAPYVISLALTGLIWSFVLNPSSGFINNFLSSIGLDSWRQDWINGRVLSPYSFGVVNAWSSMGFYISLWQVGLRSISTDILEAGLIDGTSKWCQIRCIILPILRGTMASILIFVITTALKTYEIVYILTDGGPVRLSESIVSYMYTTMFTNGQYSYGMTVAVVEFVVAMVFTLSIRKMGSTRKV